MAIALSGNTDGDKITDTSSNISPESKKGFGDMIGGCSVCSEDQGTHENPLVYCDSCELAVHQACYGIVKIPAGSWFCKKCESADSQTIIHCELCPSKDGALKKTETGKWAHVVCALYIPEVRFGNNNTMEPILINNIRPERYSKHCYLCAKNGNSSSTSTTGAVMDCYKVGCKQSFHVTCAQAAGLLCEEADRNNKDDLIYCGYCKHHFRKSKAGARKAKNNSSNSLSYPDSASDSSQDNDSRGNSIEQNDKISANRTTNKNSTPLPETLSTNNRSRSPISPRPSSTAPTKTTTNIMSANSPGSLSLSTNSSGANKSSSSSSASSTPQKKKRPAKSNSSSVEASTASTTNLQSWTNSSSQPMQAASSTPSFPGAVSQPSSRVFGSVQESANDSSKDVNELLGAKEQQSEKAASTGSKSSKKKPNNTDAQASTPKQSSSLTVNPSVALNNDLNTNKVNSPNLSVTTSPSLASPSNSTKSSSNSSSTLSNTSSSCSSSSSSSVSTLSNSPSPALVSPNVTNRGPTTRLESPLASNLKKSSIAQNQTNSETNSNVLSLPYAQNPTLQTRINLDKSDLKKNSAASASLLSTAVPMSYESTSSTTFAGSSNNANNSKPTAAAIDVPQIKLASKGDDSQNSKLPTTGSSNESLLENNKTPSNSQPSVPPLIIPVPQATPTVSTNGAKSPTKAKTTGAKSTRKKSTDVNEGTKVERKPKPSRSRKAPAAAAAVATNGNGAPPAPPATPSKPETKRGKGKAAANKSQEPANLTTGPATNPPAAKVSTPAKRKSRSASNESGQGPAPAPVKRQRKKKADVNPTDTTTAAATMSLPTSTNNTSSIFHPAISSSSINNTTGPLVINTPNLHNRLLTNINTLESQDINNRFLSPNFSPYTGIDPLHAPSLSRSSLSRLFTSSSVDNAQQNNAADDIGRAFEELRDGSWSHLSKFVLEQAQQFDIPSLVGTLYTLRSENEKLVNKVRDLTMRRDQLLTMNARLDMPGPVLTQHLNNTSPNFTSVVSSLANSPKGLSSTASPGSAMSKTPYNQVGPYNHGPPLSVPVLLDRSSPLVGQTPHSGVNNIKSSTISTPSPPIGALMAHQSGTNNRAGLITVNQPYVSTMFPSPMNPVTHLGQTIPQTGSSFYPRQ